MRIGRFVFEPGLVPSLVAAPLLALLLTLGVWQLHRAEEKELRIARFAQAQVEPPRTLDGTEAANLVDQLVVASGGYDAGRQFLLDNRTHRGQAGYHVLTPLRRADGSAVLVNRGWVPVGPDRQRLPDLSVTTQAHQVRGLGAAAREDQMVLGETGYARGGGWPRVVQRVQLEQMQALLGYRLEPLLVLLEPAAPDGYVRDWQPYLGIGPDRHRGYALQWFSLGTALAVIYLVVNTHRVRDPRPEA